MPNKIHVHAWIRKSTDGAWWEAFDLGFDVDIEKVCVQKWNSNSISTIHFMSFRSWRFCHFSQETCWIFHSASFDLMCQLINICFLQKLKILGMATGLWDSNKTNDVPRFLFASLFLFFHKHERDDGTFFYCIHLNVSLSSFAFCQSSLFQIILIHSTFIIQNNNNKWVSDNHRCFLMIDFPIKLSSAHI